jgi:glycosyltransferase involved in cell wall biosynthesis
MKIALNATMFRPSQMGGMETYFRNLFSALQEVDKQNRYSLICDSRYIDELAVAGQNFSVKACNFTKPSLGWFFRGIIRNLTTIDPLRIFMNRLQVDVIHHPFSILNPLHLKGPSVLTFHDMQHEFFPEYFSPFEMKGRKEFYRPSAEQATRIIAISEHAKSCLVERYKVSPEKIDVIYIGYNSQYRVVGDRERLDGIRLKYGLHHPFMYYPAATWPHKNHKGLLVALKLLKDRYGFDGKLVLTGISMKSSNEVMREIRRLCLEDTVIVLGYLPNDELPCLYNLARLMVFPSLFEGFGIPLIEAMACGCPVACSNAASIPEVVGDAAALFDPLSNDDIAEKIWMLWNDETTRGELVSKGMKRLGMFRWEIAARETIKVYEKVIG